MCQKPVLIYINPARNLKNLFTILFNSLQYCNVKVSPKMYNEYNKQLWIWTFWTVYILHIFDSLFFRSVKMIILFILLFTGIRCDAQITFRKIQYYSEISADSEVKANEEIWQKRIPIRALLCFFLSLPVNADLVGSSSI